MEARKSVDVITNQMADSPSSHRRQHLHELPHYIDTEKQNTKELIVKKKLTETRASAEQVISMVTLYSNSMSHITY